MAKSREEDEHIDVDDTIDDSQHNTQQVGYSWEEEYKRSWDIVQEDEHGSIQSVVANLQQQLKRRRLLRDTATLQRGIIRHLFLVLDASEAMAEKDLRPSRLDLTLDYARQFVLEFFDQNPISQLGIIATRDGIAEKLSDLSGNPNDHIKILKDKKNQDTSGEPSLQNSLEMARNSLSHVPSHGSREIVIIYGSLTTCDPGDITDTINALKQENIRVSVVALAAEMQILKTLCHETRGQLGVVLNETHYKELLFEMIPPPPVTTAKSSSNLVMMGFPKRLVETDSSLCVCHGKLTVGGFLCPRCSAKVCDIPTDCDICGLTLVSSPHLARSYHHLFPVNNYIEVPWKSAVSDHCFSCQIPFESKPPPTTRTTGPGAIPSIAQETASSGRYQCSKCKQHFCVDCDIFVHEVLHNCPGCWAGKQHSKA
ncbi:uncharacterized protein VTP21DRAFT_7848 [Calcarisporiella thermophila]|uniref:uncharacterized protein n=1 Tax=Calcarisporiella thermophila TaxID=911321 RepID=UPI0037434294